MLAAAHVNWHYLAILLLPLAAAVVALALTWYSRARRRREEASKPSKPPRSSGAKRSGTQRQAAPQVAQTGARDVDVLVGFDAIPWQVVTPSSRLKTAVRGDLGVRRALLLLFEPVDT